MIRIIKDSIGKFLNTFRIKKEERLPAIVITLLMAALNVLAVSKFHTAFSKTHQAIWGLFVNKYTVSGFDPITYCVLTEWEPKYEIYRHPLLAYFEYPLYLLNHELTLALNYNAAQVIIAVILVFLASYTWIFLYRILREIIALGRTDALLISLFSYSFGYVMLTFMVPDHFALSMFMLVTCLYVCGKAMQKGRQLKIWQTWIIFFFTAGTTLSNGIKVFLNALFVNGRSFFRPKYLLSGVIVPSLMIWCFAEWEHEEYAAPRERASLNKRIKKGKEERGKHFKNFSDTTSLKDSTAIAKAFDRKMRQIIHAKYVADHKQPWHTHKGKPMGDGKFMKWTDETTSRTDALVENIFGEPIQLHQDYVLKDVLVNRPVLVQYRWVWNYVVEGVVALLFLVGIWCGRKNRYMWLVMSFFGFDMFIHFVLGFGLNEVYIMSPHWLFAIPIAMAYLAQRVETTRLRVPLRVLTLLLTLYLLVWNAVLYIDYML